MDRCQSAVAWRADASAESVFLNEVFYSQRDNACELSHEHGASSLQRDKSVRQIENKTNMHVRIEASTVMSQAHNVCDIRISAYVLSGHHDGNDMQRESR